MGSWHTLPDLERILANLIVLQSCIELMLLYYEERNTSIKLFYNYNLFSRWNGTHQDLKYNKILRIYSINVLLS